MTLLEIVSRGARQTQELGEHIGKLARPGDVVLLVGGLGSGKTCLTQGIARGLGVSQYTSSPSFVLVREYSGRLPMYHVDLYRLTKLVEVADLGLDDYFLGKGLSVVEWADRALELLPQEHMLVNMSYMSQMRRKLRFEPRGQRYKEMLLELRLTYFGLQG
ncbi:MAG: tRNA (adenosine(37)-N6)-threonylcarbamoyltransferase complex ATPase subunit type 1 TsaE [Chloroflexota bacterium]